MDEKYAKITKESHAYKGYPSSYNTDIFNYFIPELQLKDTESTIRNKLKDLLSEMRDFIFVTTLVKKVESGDATKYTTFYSNSKAEIIQ